MRPEPQQQIDRNARKVWRITGAIISFFYWTVPALYILLHHMFGLITWIAWVLAGIALLLSIISIWIIPGVRWRRWRYEVTEHELDIQHGVLVIHRTLIPMVRIQHVDTHQGPLLRYYNLSSVTISTAAGSHMIPALHNEVADSVRDRIAKLARVADEHV